MTFPRPIDYYDYYYYSRHCCLLLLLLLMSTSLHCPVVTSINVADWQLSKERLAKGVDDKMDTSAAAAETRSVKVNDDDDDGDNEENKHFMDVYSLQSGPQQLEFGHVFEDPSVWEQRYEKKDFGAQRYQGKMKWGDKDGGYGEQYWDLNHGGAGESARDSEEYGQYEETTPPAEYVQESHHRAVMYKPVTITSVLQNKPKRNPVRSVRNSPKRLLGPQTTPTIIGNVDKKSAPVLVFDMHTGVVMDEATGNKFVLKPINYAN